MTRDMTRSRFANHAVTYTGGLTAAVCISIYLYLRQRSELLNPYLCLANIQLRRIRV